MLANLPFPELEISDIGRTSWCAGQQAEPAGRVGEGSKDEKEFQQYSKGYIISISSSEGDGSFQELSSRQSNRSNQILTVTDMASLRGRYCEICITRGSIYLALYSHLLVRMWSKLTRLKEAEKILICYLYEPVPVIPWPMVKANVNPMCWHLGHDSHLEWEIYETCIKGQHTVDWHSAIHPSFLMTRPKL